jgi:hypothetical protein
MAYALPEDFRAVTKAGMETENAPSFTIHNLGLFQN